MLGSLQSQISKLLGQSSDPLGLITPDQLKAVLKSIEGKYNALRDENKRLKNTIAELKDSNERLEAKARQVREEAERETRSPEADEELQRLRSEYAVVQQAVDTLRAELLKSHDEIESVRSELTKTHSASDSWRIELHEARQDSTRLMNDLSQATLDLEAARAETEQVREELASVRARLAQEEEVGQDRESELMAFRDRAINPFLHAQVVEERDVLRRENEQLAGRILELNAALEALKTELSESRQTTQVIATTTDNKIQEKLTSLENERMALRLESDRLKRELQGKVQTAFKGIPPQSAAKSAQAKGMQPNPAKPKVDAQSAEDRRRLLAQLINGQK